MSNNTTTELDYDYTLVIEETMRKSEHLNQIRILYMVMYLFICVTGLILNSYVIIAGGYAYHRFRGNSYSTVREQHTSIWLLALAIIHLIFSIFLVLQFLYAHQHFNWHFGTALCKLSSYVFYFSMFATAALLSLWSVTICVWYSSCFQSWQCADQSKAMVITMVLSSFTLGAILSSPSLLSRELRITELGRECIDDYDLNKEKTTDYGASKLTAVVLCRFLLGILFPMFMMISSSCIAKCQEPNENGTCGRIPCLIKVAYFICWTPLLLMGLIQVSIGNQSSFKYGLPVATLLAAGHCLINPIIYLLVGGKINMEWMLKVSGQNNPRHENIGL